MDKTSKTKINLNELKTIHCNVCNSNLIMKYLNQSQQIILCSNKKVRIKIIIFI